MRILNWALLVFDCTWAAVNIAALRLLAGLIWFGLAVAELYLLLGLRHG